MKKLYIILFTAVRNGFKNEEVKYYWAKSEEKAQLTLCNDCKVICIIDTIEVKEAIHKQDLADKLERYIAKPILNKELTQI